MLETTFIASTPMMPVDLGFGLSAKAETLNGNIPGPLLSLNVGDTVIVRWDGHGVANDGRPYDNSYAWFMTVRDGKVIDGTAFFDSISFNDLWTRVPPQT